MSYICQRLSVQSLSTPILTVAYCWRILLLLIVFCVPLILLHVEPIDHDLSPRDNMLLQKGVQSFTTPTVQSIVSEADLRHTARRRNDQEEAVDKVWRSVSGGLSAPSTVDSSMAEAWPPSASRNLSVYVRPQEKTALLLPPSVGCAPWLLILVHSSARGFKARMAVRTTWALWANRDITIRFVVGAANDRKIMRALQLESEVYRDIVQEDFLDVYSNLTLKSIFGLKWALSHCKARFIMKCDEDVFVHLPNLVEFLYSHGKPKSIMGVYTVNSPVIRRPGSKYYAPMYMFPYEVYPKYASGTAYVLHHEVAVAVFRQAFHVPLLHLEDVFITGILAAKVAAVPVHSDRFVRHWSSSERSQNTNLSPRRKTFFVTSSSYLSNLSNDPLPDLCSLVRLITCHSVTPAQMKTVWLRLHGLTSAAVCVPCWMVPWAGHCRNDGGYGMVCVIIAVLVVLLWLLRSV